MCCCFPLLWPAIFSAVLVITALNYTVESAESYHEFIITTQVHLLQVWKLYFKEHKYIMASLLNMSVTYLGEGLLYLNYFLWTAEKYCMGEFSQLWGQGQCCRVAQVNVTFTAQMCGRKGGSEHS